MGQSTATSDWLSEPGRFQPLPSRSLLSDARGLDLEVPPLFTVSVSPGRAGRGPTADTETLCREGIAMLERETGRRFGTTASPLLVSVRIATRPKVPGRSPGVLNLGLTRRSARQLALTRGEQFAHELLVRLMATYAHGVRGADVPDIHACQARAADDKAALIELLDELMSQHGGPLPADPHKQLLEAVGALRLSWNDPAALRDMDVLGIDPRNGAIGVQAMAYANAGEHSGKGVAVTRDPVSGAPGLRGRFTPRSQGGLRLLGDPGPQPLLVMRRRHRSAYASLSGALALLEAAEQDMCAVEFVVESGALRVLEVRSGTHSGPAAIRIAADLVDAGLIDIPAALRRISPSALRAAQQPVPRREHDLPTIVWGAAASAGMASGPAALSAAAVADFAAADEHPILLQEAGVYYTAETVAQCAGVVSAGGGSEAQGAEVARMLGLPAITHAALAPSGGAPGAPDGGQPSKSLAQGASLGDGDPLLLDADRGGFLYRGETELVAAQPDTHVALVLGWCADNQRVPVFDTVPPDYMTLTQRKAAGELQGPVLIDIQGVGMHAASARRRQVKAALRAGPRKLALKWSDDLERLDGRLPVAPWTMVVAPPERQWAAQLVATRLRVEPATATAKLEG